MTEKKTKIERAARPSRKPTEKAGSMGQGRVQPSSSPQKARKPSTWEPLPDKAAAAAGAVRSEKGQVAAGAHVERMKADGGERIAKVLARAGVCSRREAETLILEGRVRVDGKVLASPALNVTDKNRIMVDGRPLPEREEPRVWRYHKAAGVITTARDPQGRPTVFERLPPSMPRVISVGRLDFNTEGLLLLTNDGELARYLELPANAWVRQYRVRVHGRVDQKRLDALANGVTISGINYGPVKAELVKEKEARLAGKESAAIKDAPSNVWVHISIREGKNREVRKLMEHLGLQVTRLMRVAFGPFQLGVLPKGMVEEVPRKFLRDQLGAHFKKVGS